MLQLTLADVSKQLTKPIIKEAFQTKTNSKDRVQMVQVTRAARIGEGLLSAVYRICVSGNNRSACFVAKGLVQDSLLRKTLRCSTFFKREVYFFANVLPVLVELQKSLGAKERLQNNVPICYDFVIDGHNDYILMEDLLESGCESISKTPSEVERNETLKVLAHLHSVSMALRLRKPFLFTKIANELSEVYYLEENRSWYKPYLQRAIELDIDVLAEEEGTSNSIYCEKFKKVVSEDPYSQLIKLVSVRSEHVVFNHGDAWCPNFLRSKERTVAIDFQLFRTASPATDLSYFILLCSKLCRNKNDFTKAVDEYYSYLEFYLKDMNINCNEIFTKQMLYKELKIYGKFGLLAAVTTIPLLASERCDVLQSYESEYVGLERIPLEKLWKLTPIKDEKLRKCLINAVHVAVDVGLI